jgi:hypothetical protein
MMSNPPSSFSLTASSGSEWVGSTPALGRRGGLSFVIRALLDACREDRQVDEGGVDGDLTKRWAVMWKDASVE